MTTVHITGISPDPETYADLAAANYYAGSHFSPQFASWLAATDDIKGQTLVTATSRLEAIAWDGTATGLLGSTPTTLAFPRTGLLRDGVAVDSATVPKEIVDGTIELAVAILAKPALVNAVDQGSNLSSVQGGGGVGASFFAPTSAAQGTAPVLPPQVQRLVGRFMATAGADGSFGQSGKACSGYARNRQYTLGWPEE